MFLNLESPVDFINERKERRSRISSAVRASPPGFLPGGGLTVAKKWKNTRNKGKFLYPVKALSAVFRSEFCDYLIDLHNKGEIVLDTLFDPKHKYLYPFYKMN